MSVTINKRELHLPDLQFSQLCEKKYGINRGIYNTIETCFFQKGIENILVRRSMIIEFLCDISDECKLIIPGKRVKFGHGGLVSKLNEYWVNATENRMRA